MMKRTAVVVCCFLAILMIGCGGSSSSSKGITAASMKGIFADAPVAGLSYACGTQTGVTGADGSFNCPTGSNVTFTVGGITLCSGPVQSFMTPVSCAQITDPSANTSSPSVVAVARFLQSISTTPASSGTLTITSAELETATHMSLNFSTATEVDLQAAVIAINPGATLVDAATAQRQLLATINGGIAGKYLGTFSGPVSGTWQITIASDGSISGSASDSKGNPAPLSGNLASGTTFSGTAGSGTWTGTLNTSKSPVVFSGTWTDDSGASGTFTGTKQ
jgi:hypothetical protein